MAKVNQRRQAIRCERLGLNAIRKHGLGTKKRISDGLLGDGNFRGRPVGGPGRGALELHSCGMMRVCLRMAFLRISSA